MGYDKPILQTSNPYKKDNADIKHTRVIYYGEVVTIDDPTEGGMIKVKILELDNKTGNADLPWCYPMLPKYFFVLPKVGEYVRIFIEDIQFPQRSRYWMGSVISQLPNINFDTIYTALSTTNMALTNPQPAPSTYPNADGIYPEQEDIAIIGRCNSDFMLKTNEVQIRAGQHVDGDVYTLNTLNPATVDLNFEQIPTTTNFYSNTIIQSDKIAILSHTGNPQFKTARLTTEDRTRIFSEGHPMVRGDVLVEALNIMRDAIVTHLHPYANLPADMTTIINSLNNIDFNAILQENLVIN